MENNTEEVHVSQEKQYPFLNRETKYFWIEPSRSLEDISIWIEKNHQALVRRGNSAYRDAFIDIIARKITKLPESEQEEAINKIRIALKIKRKILRIIGLGSTLHENLFNAILDKIDRLNKQNRPVQIITEGVKKISNLAPSTPIHHSKKKA